LTSETDAPAEIEILGAMSNLHIINITNGSEFDYLGTLSDGGILTVATDGTVLLNGSKPNGIYTGTLTAGCGFNSFMILSDISDAYSRANITLRGDF